MLWLLGAVMALAAGAPTTVIAEPRALVTRARRARIQAMPAKLKTAVPPGIRLWGTHEGDDATWNPGYVKSLGCKHLRWGFCVQQYMDHSKAEAKKQGIEDEVEALERAEAVVWRILKWYSLAGVKIAKWILANTCLRFSWEFRKYEDVNGGQGWAIHIHEGEGEMLFPPPHPLPRRDGYKRIWFMRGNNWTRNETVVTTFWPKEDQGQDAPVVMEVIGQDQIRAMLRMDADVTGAVDVQGLNNSNALCGEHRWWPARKKLAKPEF